MAGDANAASAMVLARFGLGARPGDLNRSGRDVLAAMREESTAPVAQPAGPALPDAVDALAELDEFRTETRKKREAEAARLAQAANGEAPMMAGSAQANAMQAPSALPNMTPRMDPPQRVIFRKEVQARLDLALSAPLGFAERWVWFWSNHFCISIAKGQPLRVLAGNYERTVIRPHAFGRFAQMLKASAKHPAMLIYLDNRQSIGPGSKAGQRRAKGLNENLAREILELHTLGVNGGYTQADVTSLARIITGWTIIGPADEEGEIGEFRFNPNRHEPGPQTLLGRAFADDGVKQGEAALEFVAAHPSTAKFVATKVARHFVADNPPPALVARLAEAFTRSGGDLGELARALLAAPEALEAPPAKLRSPQDFVVAALRATGRKGDAGFYLHTLNALGQPLWNPNGPNGFPDIKSHWLSPEGMKVRLEVAANIGRSAPGTQSPSEVLEATLGAAASAETRQAVARAESRAQGLALLLMAPEFQRK